jgi:aspartate racemase
MKTIGLMGGMGWEGSAAYYRVINRQVRAALGGFHSAQIVMDSLDFDSIATAQSRDEFAEVERILVSSAMRLEGAGCELLVIACNTVHRLAPAVERAITIPFLHIADAAGRALTADGHVRVGLLGTRATVEAGFYKKRLAASMGLDIVLPPPEMRAEVDEMISKELARGNTPQDCAGRLDAAVDYFAKQECSAVLLACTEFGLAYGAKDEPILSRALPCYDTAVVHAEAAVSFALG